MSVDSNCEHLDAFLSDDLSADQRTIFESHLDECPACHEALDQQRWIDDLLNSPMRTQVERPSATIVDSVRVSLANRRRHILQVVCGLATAATLFIAAVLLEHNHDPTATSKSNEQNVAATPATHAPTRTQPLATFVTIADSIVVPLESPSDDVTVVQVYPTTDAERRWHLEATLSTKL